MSIAVIGVGPEAYKEIHNMKKMAGETGKVLLYEGYDKLFRHFDDILEAVCGKWKLCILIETFRQTGNLNYLV